MTVAIKNAIHGIFPLDIEIETQEAVTFFQMPKRKKTTFFGCFYLHFADLNVKMDKKDKIMESFHFIPKK